MQAVESGDVQAQQKAVDAAAKAANFEEETFLHHTFGAFNVFIPGGPASKKPGYANRVGVGGDQSGKAIWLESEKHAIESRPLDSDLPPIMHRVREAGFKNKTEARSKLLTKRLKVNMLFPLYGTERQWQEDLIPEYGFNKDFPLLVKDSDIQIMKRLGRDGAVIASEKGSIREAVVLNPNQIKSADPITRDDQGNVIPLSERFNDQSNDIRYQYEREKYNQVPGSKDPKIRAIWEGHSADYIPESKSEASAIAQAEQALSTDEGMEAARLELMRDGATDPEDMFRMKKAQILVERLMQYANANPSDNDAQDRMNLASLAYHKTGSATGRDLQQRHDPLLTPQAKLLRQLMTPGKDILRRLARAKPGSAEESRLLKVLREDQAKARELLKAKGLDFDSINWADNNDVMKAHRILAAMQTTNWDKAYEYWISMGLLSGVATQSANITGNSLSGAWEFFVQQPVEITISKLTFRKGENARHYSELQYAAQGFMNGFKPAIRNMIKSYREERSAFEEDFLGVDSHAKHRLSAAIGGTKGRVIRMPLRSLQAADDMYKTIYGYMGAYQAAIKIALNEKMEGQVLSDFVANQISNPQSDSWDLGLQKALVLTFQNDAGNMAKGLNVIRQTVPGTRYLAPFVTVVGNILNMGFAKSPLGSVALMKRVAEEGFIKYVPGSTTSRNADPAIRYKRQQQIERGVAEQVVAWVFTLGLAELLWDEDDDEDNGPRITGSIAPGSERWRQKWMDGVIQPHSIRIGDKYYSYSRIEPLGTSLGLIIDALVAAETSKSGKDFGDAMGKAFREMSQVALDKTYLYGMSDLMESMRTDKGALQWMQNFATSWSPNIVRSVVRASDMNVPNYKITEPSKYHEGVGQNLLHKALPLPKVGPPKKRNIWGEVVEKPFSEHPLSSFLFEVASPVRVMDTSDKRHIDLMIMRLNEKASRGEVNKQNNPFEPLTMSFPQSHGTRNNKPYELTRDQYDRMIERRGEIAWSYLKNKFTDSQQLDPGERESQFIQSAFRKASARARSEILREVL